MEKPKKISVKKKQNLRTKVSKEKKKRLERHRRRAR